MEFIFISKCYQEPQKPNKLFRKTESIETFYDESELYKREGDSSLHLFFPDPMLLMAITKYHYRRRNVASI
jgi:hypothetical protein